MNLLLDSHTLVWFVTGQPRCSDTALRAIEARDSLVHVSAATLWEIATKHRLGKWPDGGYLLDRYGSAFAELGLLSLPITLEHARLAGSMPGAHKDPFDRMLAAQARLEDLVLVTADPAFAQFDVRTIW